MTIDVAVIGGGISGLATAFDLKRRGREVLVLERQVRPGGNARSEHFDGFLMEQGPSTIGARSDAANQISAVLGLEAQRCDLGEGVRRRYLVGGGKLQGISVHPLGFFLSNYLSLGDRARLMAEIAIPPRCGTLTGEESVADYCTRRFGRGFAERVMDPLVGGLYGGRAKELSMSAVFPKLLEMEQRYGSVTRGVLAQRRKTKMPGRRLFSWREGVGALPRALARKLGDAVRTGVTVRRIRRQANGFVIDTGRTGDIHAEAIVIATQPHVASGLLDGVDNIAAEAAAAIDAPPLAVVFLGYRRSQVDHPLDGLGYLAAEAETKYLNGAQFCSTMFPGRAPDGFIAVAGYAGGARNPELGCLPEDDLISLVKEEFRDLLGAKGEPSVAKVRHWPQGIPQYRLGHGEKIARIKSACDRSPGLFLTGNYFCGPAVSTCLKLALKTAGDVDHFLQSSRKVERKGVACG